MRTGRAGDPTSARGRFAAGALSLLLLVSGAVLVATPAQAAELTPEIFDEGDLTAAINDAVAGDTVIATLKTDIDVSAPLPHLSSGSLTILGDGFEISATDGAAFGSAVLFYLTGSAHLTIENATLTIGTIGGAILAVGSDASNAPTVTLSDVDIVANSFPGGITVYDGSLHATDLTITGTWDAITVESEYGSVDLHDVDIDGPSGCGIAVDLAGDAVFTASGLDVSDADCIGLGVSTGDSASATISDSVFSSNHTGVAFLTYGTGTITFRDSSVLGTTFNPQLDVWVATGSIVVSGTTISGGQVDGLASVSALIDGGHFVLEHSTVTNNPVSGGYPVVFIEACSCVSTGTATIDHTIIAGNGNTDAVTGDLEISGAAATIDHSFIGIVGNGDVETIGVLTAGAGNIFGTGTPLDPALGSLALNGGTTPNHLPDDDSPVVNAGDPAFTAPPASDQRGAGRISSGVIDIGAVEVQFAPTLTLSPSAAGIGEQVTATGTGFAPNTTFTMQLNSTPVVLGTVTSNASGAFTFAFTVSQGVTAGPHTLTPLLAGNIAASAALTVRGLPATGTDSGPLTLLGVVLLLAGVGAGRLARRRAA